MTSENGDATGQRTCPNYFYAARMNEWFRPDVLVGYHVSVMTDVSRTLGTRSTAAAVLTNKLLLSTLYPHGLEFGASFRESPAAPGQTEGAGVWRTEKAFVQTDLDGRLAAGVRFSVLDRCRVQVCGQRESGGRGGLVHAVLEWAGDAANWRLTAAGSAHARPTVSADHVLRVARGLRVGLQFSYVGDGGVPGAWCAARMSDSWDYSGMLRYDRDAAAVSLSVTRSMDAAVRCQRIVSGRLTVGVEVTGNPRAGHVKTSWTHRYAFDDGVEVRGLLDTDGMVVGNFRKTFLPNLTVCLCTILNHKNSNFGLGLEIVIGPKSEQDNFSLQ